jgi:hypothetical protein
MSVFSTSETSSHSYHSFSSTQISWTFATQLKDYVETMRSEMNVKMAPVRPTTTKPASMSTAKNAGPGRPAQSFWIGDLREVSTLPLSFC